MQKCLKLKKVLSVDWDYFVNANLIQRSMHFPDGRTENISGEISDLIWASRYDSSNKSKKIFQEKYADRTRESIPDFKIKKEYYQLRKIFKTLTKDTFVLITDSHSGMYDLVKYISNLNKNKIQFEIDNVDYHHDLFSYGDDPDCGNWLRLLIQEEKISKVMWIRHDDSELPDPIPNIDTLYGIEHTTDFNYIVNKKYDTVFLCKSRIWSPPHLDTRFISIVKLLERPSLNTIVDKESGIKINRMKKILSTYGNSEEIEFMMIQGSYESFKKFN